MCDRGGIKKSLGIFCPMCPNCPKCLHNVLTYAAHPFLSSFDERSQLISDKYERKIVKKLPSKNLLTPVLHRAILSLSLILHPLAPTHLSMEGALYEI